MNEEKTLKVEEEEIILWANLPGDVLGLIATRLSAPELFIFRGVCKPWRQWFETSSYQSDITDALTSMRPSDDVTRFPVLMNVHRKFCTFFHPMYNTTIRRVIPELVDAMLFHAKGEWLLLARRMKRGDNGSIVIFFFNVNTMVKIDIHSLPTRDNGSIFVFNNMCFFSNPDSTDWSIIGINGGYEIGTIKHGQPSWTLRKFHHYAEIYTNPVVVVSKRGELCYILGNDGSLLSFDPSKLTEEGVIRLQKVSKKPPLPPLPLRTIQNNRYYVQIEECFLVPVNGNKEYGVLLAIFKHKISNEEDKISRIPSIYKETYITSVYEFNIGKREWRKLDNLGNRMLFVARTGSMLFQVGEEASNTMMMAKNKVYYPNVQMGNIVFFSLTTESDHCFLLNAHPYGHISVVTKQKIDNDYPPSFPPSNCGWIGHMSSSFFRYN